MNKLTEIQDKFCEAYVETGVASEAFRRAYPSASRLKDSTIWSKSSRLMKNPLVEKRIMELKEEARRNSDVTKQEILDLCRDIIRGQQVPDHQETTPRGKKVVGMSRSWAVDRLCKMLGFDQALELNIKTKEEEMSEEDIRKEIERLNKLD